jgi:hypothetical protein
MPNTRDLFHEISYLQSPIMIIAVTYAKLHINDKSQPVPSHLDLH